MGVFCLLFDKKKQYFQLLADIFGITGHKLLVALDEEKAIGFLEVTSPEIILLPLEDIDFWFRLLEKEKYLLPLFFVENPEDIERIKRYGLIELNYVLLPFNPMELLSKLVKLSEDIRQQANLSQLGPINTLLKLLNYKKDLAISFEGKEGVCTLYISNGTIKGSDCSSEKVINLIAEEGIIIKLEASNKEGYLYTFKNSWDFFSKLFAYEVVSKPYVEEVHTTIDLSQPIKLEENFYWVGVEDKKSLFQKNVYLRIFEKESIRIPILINIGAAQDYPIIRLKLEQIIGSIDLIKGVVLLGSEIDEASGVFTFLQSNHTAYVITSLNIANKLKGSGIPQSRIRTIEALPGERLKLATGDVLRFIPTPFLPAAGSFMLLEVNRGYLFTGRFLSSMCSLEEFNPQKEAKVEDVVLYTSMNLPFKDKLIPVLKKIEDENISSVYTMFGNPILSKNTLKEILEKLSSIPEKFYQFNADTLSTVCEDVLIFLEKNLEKAEFEAFSEEFNQFVFLENGKILQSFVEVEEIPKLIINLLISKNTSPKLVKEVIRRFYMAGVLLTI